MSKDYLPIHVNPVRFAENATALHGTLHIKDMQRLCDSLLNHEGEVQVEIQFGVDEQKIRFLRGQLRTQLNLQCQRCLEPFTHEIASRFLAGIVTDENEALALPSNFDPLIVKDAELNVQDMIEEELILSLPIVPMHDAKDCKVELPLVANNILPLAAAEHDNPFKVIESLKGKLKKE